MEVVVEGQGKGKGRERSVSPDELEAELLRLSSSLGAQWAARSRAAEGKVREWGAKEGELRRAGEEGRADWARGNVEKAVTKV